MCVGFTKKVILVRAMDGADMSPSRAGMPEAAHGSPRGEVSLQMLPSMLSLVLPLSLVQPHWSTVSAYRASAGCVCGGPLGEWARPVWHIELGRGGSQAADTSRCLVWFLTWPGRARCSAPWLLQYLCQDTRCCCAVSESLGQGF